MFSKSSVICTEVFYQIHEQSAQLLQQTLPLDTEERVYQTFSRDPLPDVHESRDDGLAAAAEVTHSTQESETLRINSWFLHAY